MAERIFREHLLAGRTVIQVLAVPVVDQAGTFALKVFFLVGVESPRMRILRIAQKRAWRRWKALALSLPTPKRSSPHDA